MSERTAAGIQNFRNSFRWVVRKTHIDSGESMSVCLAKTEIDAMTIALTLSQNKTDFYYDVEEL